LELISNFHLFLGSVILISLSGVLLPGPLFATTIQKSAKNKIAGSLIAFGHGVVEFPLMILIYFLLRQFAIPNWVQITVGIIGGVFMIFMGVRAFKNRNQQDKGITSLKRDSFISGIWTTAVNAGFILWWLTIGTALIANAQLFGTSGVVIFASMHWTIDFLWYTIVGLIIFKSQKFWTKKIHQGITVFCAGTFLLFGVYFIISSLTTIFTRIG
jgi:threonine/homoserine/homoserine lactone efflux protein